MILQPLLGGHVLGEGLVSYPAGDRVWIPLGQLSSLLAFGIRVDATTGRAEGFLIEEKRRFTLDIPKGKIVVDGKTIDILPGQAVSRDRDIFMDIRLLTQCFPLDLEVNLKSATLQIKALETLPIQEIWDRELRYGQFKSGLRDGLEDTSIGVAHTSSYRLADCPFLDASLALIKTQHISQTPWLGSLTTGGDLLWMSSNLSVVRDPDGSFRNSRATLFREDPEGKLLGPMRAQRLFLGDLPLAPSLELAGSLPRGRGVLVDNYPMAYRSRFATRTFQGLLPQNWTVELYQNNGLLGYCHSRPDGRYEFPDIPLAFGLNQFQLVFHGPQGQVRHERFRLDIRNDQPPPGAFYYRLAGVHPERQRMPGVEASVSEKEALGKPSLLVEGEYGLNPWLAVKGGGTRMALPDGSHDYGVLGVRSVFSFLALQGNLAQERKPDGRNGQSAEGILKTGYGYSSLTLRRAEFRGGFMPAHGTAAFDPSLALKSESQAELNGHLNWGAHPLTLGLAREEQMYAQGGRLRRTRLGASLTWPSLSVSPSIAQTLDTRNTWSPKNWEGNVLISSFGARFSTQGELNFARENGKNTFKKWAISANTYTFSGLNLRFGVQGSGKGFKDTSWTANLSQLRGPFGYGLDAQFSKATGYSISLRFQISTAREPKTRRWVTDAQSLTSTGAVSAEAFLDENANHRRDQGERVIEGAAFRLGMITPIDRVDDPRVAFYTQQPTSQEQLLRIEESSLEDPSQVPAFPAFRILNRPGHVHRVDYPVQIQGEINGSTRLREKGQSRELSGLEIELVRSDGHVFKKWRTAYDGFFEIRGIPPGAYKLQVSAEEVRRLGLKATPPRHFQIDVKNNYFEGKDLIVEYLEKPLPEPEPELEHGAVHD